MSTSVEKATADEASGEARALTDVHQVVYVALWLVTLVVIWFAKRRDVYARRRPLFPSQRYATVSLQACV